MLTLILLRALSTARAGYILVTQSTDTSSASSVHRSVRPSCFLGCNSSCGFGNDRVVDIETLTAGFGHDESVSENRRSR